MFEVHIYHGLSDDRSYLTIHSFSNLSQAQRYLSDGRRRRGMLVDVVNSLVLVRKGEWF